MGEFCETPKIGHREKSVCCEVILFDEKIYFTSETLGWWILIIPYIMKTSGAMKV